MSTKQLFLTHEADDIGKKLDYLPMMRETCNQNSGFLCMFKVSFTRISSFLCMTHTTGAQR